MQKDILEIIEDLLTSNGQFLLFGYPIMHKLSEYLRRHKKFTYSSLLVLFITFSYFTVFTDKKDMILSNAEKIGIERAPIENVINIAKRLLHITKANQPKIKYTYSGKPHIVVGRARFNIKKQKGINYGKLDKLKRPTWASALITKKLIQREKKQKRQIIKINPCGWPKKNPKVKLKYHDGTNYSGYFWNRSHMIADFMGGDAVYNNLITGTREQNVGSRKNNKGMAYLETKIRNYYKKYNKDIFYTVENVYHKNEIIPRYSIVNALSNDKKINERIIVFNSANNYRINYYTGDIKKGE